MKAHANGRKYARPLIVALIIVATLGALSILIALLMIDSLVDAWWFHELGYLFYYGLRQTYKYAVLIVATLFFFIVFFLNFRLASRLIRKTAEPEGDLLTERHDRWAQRLRSGSLWIYTPLCLVLSLLITFPFFRNWERFLLFLFAPAAGVDDPVFGKDVSFYLFSYPIYLLIQKWVLIAGAILLVGVFGLYASEHGLPSARRKLPPAARWHLSILMLLLLLIVMGHFGLQRFGLVYTGSHAPTFFGPGYVEMRVTLPLIWLSILFLGATAMALMIWIHTRKGLRVTAALVVVLGLVVALRYTAFLPNVVNEYIVKPNEAEKERPYIAMNITATLSAYQLNDVQEVDFQHQRFPQNEPWKDVQDALRNIPVWNERTLETVFHQMQELRTYYTFPPVSVGRYTVSGQFQQVFLSAREIEYDNLPDSARNWVNRHLTYTHGIGAVMAPASQAAASPIDWFIHGIPPQSAVGMQTAQPRIYYGRAPYEYAIAPNESMELDYPKGEDNQMYDYTGRGGVPIASLFRKLMFAYYFKEKNIFFTTKMEADSKILFRRNIVERVRHIAPYLLLDQTPYLVVTPDGLHWVIDAFTTSAWYPDSAPITRQGIGFNYIRNSVKIVVDAYHGSVDFYIFDESDPIINAYRRIYPGVFKNKESMPQVLFDHIHYPKDFFDTQMRIYARYHQRAPQVFYHNEDLWTFAETISSDKTIPFEPYYLTLNIIGDDKLDFILLLPMMPKGRNNMRAIAVAASDLPHYGKIIVYHFPKGELVYGPEQINALINQDTEISQQFSLWDQTGSSVERGTMLLVPFKDSILFIQPIFLRATADVNIPQLQRIIMSEGQIVVMAESLEEAYSKLQAEIRQQTPQAPAPQAPPPAEEPPVEEPPPVEKPPPAQEKDQPPVQGPPEITRIVHSDRAEQ
jgi:hypothetical protein